MPATIQGHRPDPCIRQTQLAELQRIYGEVVHEQQGTIVFLAGAEGSGRRATLEALREALREDRGHPTVIAGTLAGGAYAPVAMAQKDYDQAMDVLGNLLAVPAVITVDPVFGPILGLVAQLLQLGAVSRPFIQHLAGSHRESADLSTLALKRSLREAAGQHPVVCLLEHIDAAEARFLHSLFLTSAGELVDGRPLLIVASLDGPAELGGHEPDEPDALYVARSLVPRGLAHWLPLVPMTPAEIAAWLEDVEPRLVTHLATVTAGNPTWLALLWDDLWTREKVQRDPLSDRWRLQPGHDLATIGTVQDIVGERLQVLLGNDEPAELEDTLYLLVIAALEGSTFTVAALARTLGHDEEEVAEFLDEVLRRSAEQPYGVLEEAGHVTIAGVDEERWLWRYRFVSELFWYTLDRYAFAPGRRAALCLELAGSLEQIYASKVRQVAHTLARLFAEGGDAGQAEHYRTMAANVGTAAGWYAEAQLLMAASREGWGPADYVRAAVTLNEATTSTYRVYLPRETLTIAEAAYEAARTAVSEQEEGRALNNIGWVYKALGEKQQALAYYEQALPLNRRVGNRAGEATTLNNIGGVYDDLGERQQALAYYEQALPLARKVSDRACEAATLNNIGSAYSALGKKQQALAYYEQALPLWNQVGNLIGEARTLHNIGSVYSALGEKQQALAYYEQALPLSRQVGDRIGEAWTLNNIGEVYADLGEKQQAFAYYEQALPLTRQAGDRAGEAATLNNIGEVYSNLGEKQQALAYFEQALSLRRQVDDRAGEARTLTSIGAVYDDLGEKQQAFAYYEQALSLFCQVGDRSGEATTLNNIGSVYDALGDKQQALAYYEQALPLRRQVSDRSGEATTLNNIGTVYNALGDKQQALAYYEQALPLFRQVGDRSGEAATLNNIGSVYDALKEKQQALAYYEQALPLFRQGEDRAGEAATLNNIGGVYAALGEKHKALTYYKGALILSHQVGNRIGEATILNNVGAVYDGLEDKPQALAYYEQALPLFRQVGDKAGEAYTLNNIGRVYDDRGNRQQALAYYEQALPLSRQVGDRWGESITRYHMAMVYQSLDRLAEAEAQLVEVVTLDEAIGHPDLESDRAALEEVRAARRAQAPGS